jgi:tripeptide aminopeptidase
VLCFCSHVDTAPDCSGAKVNPILHKAFNGQPMVLPNQPELAVTVAQYPYLAQHIGGDIITASGHTLLGADDKSGLAIIMDFAQYLTANPQVAHGTIKILFTPDEEVGRGTDRVDLVKVGADFAYTLDGGEAGTIEDETFCADAMQIIINGISAHPGYAKGQMVNALKVAAEVLDTLPKHAWCPEATEGREGFVHPVEMKGNAERAVVSFIVRDFDAAQLAIHEAKLKALAEIVVSQYPGATLETAVSEQYRNMKPILDQHPQVVAHAIAAMRQIGLEPRQQSIRGGTDGSRLSFMGLPCANLFTGMQGIHSHTEWIAVSDMEKAVQTLVKLVQIWERQTPAPQ